MRKHQPRRKFNSNPEAGTTDAQDTKVEEHYSQAYISEPNVSAIALPYIEGFGLLLEYFTTLYNIMKFVIVNNNIGILL